MKRWILVALLTSGCASSLKSREPATVRAATYPDLLTQHFAGGVATQALLNAGPDHAPVCQAELQYHSELTPPFLNSATTRPVVPLRLPLCTVAQQNQIFGLVMSRDHQVDIPRCTFDDAWTARHGLRLKTPRPRRRSRVRHDDVRLFKALECTAARPTSDQTVTYFITDAGEPG